MITKRIFSCLQLTTRIQINSCSRMCIASLQMCGECSAGTMNDVKKKIVRKMGIPLYFSPTVESREHLLKHEPKSVDDLPPRSMYDSFTTATIPLRQNKKLQEKYVTILGHVRLGRLMEDMDLFAVWVVQKHLEIRNLDPSVPLPYTIVTILVDKISFTSVVPQHDLDIRITGHVSWVGKSSVEVIVWLDQLTQGKWEKLTKAAFLMASRNATNTKALALNALVLGTHEDKQIFADAEERKRKRVISQQQSVFHREPNVWEQKLIHNLFVKTIDLKNRTFNMHILPDGCVWMENATLSNIIFSQPEDRNANNTVFGGFLMRHALELSWIMAYHYCKRRPHLLHISDVTFQRPVQVSSAIKMRAHVIYTEASYMQIVVAAEVTDATSGEYNTTNTFYYTYSDSVDVQIVMPKTYHEAIWYLDGRRHFFMAMERAQEVDGAQGG